MKLIWKVLLVLIVVAILAKYLIAPLKVSGKSSLVFMEGLSHENRFESSI